MAPKKNKAAAPASTPLPAQGKEGKKRTPSGHFDAAAGKDVYEPEKDSTLEHSLFAAFNTD